MAKVAVCYKWVFDEADIKIQPDLSPDFSKASRKISDYDKNAIECACQAAKKLDAAAVGISCGGEATKKSFQDALARGLDEGIWVNTEGAEDLDSLVTARALAGAIKAQEAVSMVICAEGSSDQYARQVAPRVGALLDWPVITSVCSMQIDGETLAATRKMEDCMQVVKTRLPAVVAVLPEINPAPIPGLKAVMAAKKKPVTEYTVSGMAIDMNAGTEVLETKGYVTNRKNCVLSGDTKEEVVAALVGALRKEGVI